ncbi:MAG: cadmium-containing carbonic anhydrase [Candidatus Paceibacterota bacterium]
MLKDLVKFLNFEGTRNKSLNQTHYITLGDFGLGIGKTGPKNAKGLNQETLSNLYSQIEKGKFNHTVTSTVPVICIDGRTDSVNCRLNEPSAAGGSLSFVYGYNLGTKNNRMIEEKDLVSEIIDYLKEHNYHVSVHGDNTAKCGCGACSKAANIYQYIVENIDAIAELAEYYDINISDEEREFLAKQAKRNLEETNFFAKERLDILELSRKSGAWYEDLIGTHSESAIILNTKYGTTINRSAIREVFGPEYDVFVVDIWTFDQEAKDLTIYDNDPTEMSLFVKAITVHNIATLSVLGHSSLPLITVK